MRLPIFRRRPRGELADSPDRISTDTVTETGDPFPNAARFDALLQDEIGAINQRREGLKREVLATAAGSEDDRAMLEAVGLALSGGGIRSAAFSLGALQALHRHDVLKNID